MHHNAAEYDSSGNTEMGAYWEIECITFLKWATLDDLNRDPVELQPEDVSDDEDLCMWFFLVERLAEAAPVVAAEKAGA